MVEVGHGSVSNDHHKTTGQHDSSLDQPLVLQISHDQLEPTTFTLTTNINHLNFLHPSQDSSSLKISCKTPEEAKDWVEHLSMLGIAYQKTPQSTLGKDNSPEPSLLNVPATIPATSPSGTIKKSLKSVKNMFKRDKQDPTEMTIKHSPRIDQQVDTIKNLVEKYIAIVIKNVKDRVPKVITWLVINNVNDFIDQQLVAHFYEQNMVDFVMQKPPSEQERIDKVRSMYKACKEALEIIGGYF
jgi:ribosomal protein S17E